MRYEAATVGQAARIPGLTSSDLAALTYRIARRAASAARGAEA